MSNAIWIGPVAVAGLAAGWLGVLSAWRAVFPEAGGDSDPLAGRLGCHGCGRCERECERRAPESEGHEEEGTR